MTGVKLGMHCLPVALYFPCARHGNRESQRNAARAISGLASKPHRTSYRQMIVGGIFLLALSGGIFSTVWKIVDYLTGASLFPLYDVKTDEAKLREIFFGGEPYVVYCQAGQSKLVPKLLIEGANMLSSGFSTAMLNCNEVLPSSGKNLYERFELDDKGMPAFVVANGEKPKQFNRNSFYNPEYFAEFVKVQSAPSMREITNEIQFRSFCTEKSRCLVIGHKGKMSDSTKEAVDSVMSSHRKQKFVSIDTARYAIKLDEVLSKSLEKQMGEGRTGKGYLSGLCFSMPDRTVDMESPPKAFVRRVTEGELYYFAKDCVNGVGLEAVKAVPSLDVKTNKEKKSHKKHPSSEGKPEAASSQYSDDGMEVEDLDE